MNTPWGFPDFDAHEALHFVTDAQERPARDHRAAFDPSRAGGGRHALLALCRRRRRADRRAAAVARDELQECHGRACRWAAARRSCWPTPDRTKTPELLAAFGRAVDRLGGNYVTAEDVGMSVADMIEIRDQTKFVAGLPVAGGEVGGDPGPHTSLGVFLGIKAAVKRALGKDSLSGPAHRAPGRGQRRQRRRAPRRGGRRAPVDRRRRRGARAEARRRDRRRRSSPTDRS